MFFFIYLKKDAIEYCLMKKITFLVEVEQELNISILPVGARILSKPKQNSPLSIFLK